MQLVPLIKLLRFAQRAGSWLILMRLDAHNE